MSVFIEIAGAFKHLGSIYLSIYLSISVHSYIVNRVWAYLTIYIYIYI